MIKPLDIRWISYYPAIKRIIDILNPIFDTLNDILAEEKNSITIKSINESIKTVNFILKIGYYSDMLEPVYKFSKML